MNRGLEIESPVSARSSELKDRQNQFAVLLGLDPERLRGLKFCSHCGGEDYEWTDYSMDEMDATPLQLVTSKGKLVDLREYRSYLADSVCQNCDGTGFEGGSFSFNEDAWCSLGDISTK
ncbi:hypothetical protein A3E46_00060 [Candidatus Woesebacteria bacterium RIFCSPHIGHO2_12_FULL_46_16]|uniref:Uncharacterized protein n=1 Tax=Candidatus Woesebacteria bacterium RIFCSPHIGHO2_12_FULL_46_16 TaxID=1802513 RepID=A0A1F8AVT8_9BACT|nr:MAG: hypothetical protein A3E46_00060 [Candidatus Woesebacteria bacterium RIFCSPHIGHO2_12_FULL_46_16]